MPDLLDSTGLQVKTLTEIVMEIEGGTTGYPGLKGIYGQDINLDPNSPDAQFVNIFAQAAIDLREMMVSVYQSFDPDKAVGRVLDARCAINGIFRNGGTYTTVVVNVTTDRSLSLPGMDEYPDFGAFTVADSSGTQFSLTATAPLSAGVHALTVQSVKMGATTVTTHALTYISTPTLGVVSVDNPSTELVAGTDEETDANLRIRRMKAMALPARGSYDAILSSIQAVEGVTQAALYENVTGTTDSKGVAPHGIWLVVSGGDSANIASAAYSRRPLGTPMQGSTTVNVAQSDGTTFPIKFSRPTPELLYISVTLASVNGEYIDYAGLGHKFLDALSYSIGDPAESTGVVALFRSLQANVLVTAEGVSKTAGSYTAQISTTTVDRQFYATDASLTINGTLLNAL